MSGTQKQNSVVVTDESLEISHADGTLQLETPADNEILEAAPDGGMRAWLIVMSCAGINLLQTVVFLLIRASLVIDSDEHDIMSRDTDIESETLLEVADQLKEFSKIYAPFAAFVMLFHGYKATVCIGAGVVMVTVFFLSYLGDDDTEHFIKFLIYGPTGIEPAETQFDSEDLVKKMDFDGSIVKALFYGISGVIGMLVGMFLACMFRKTALAEDSRLHMSTLKQNLLKFIYTVIIVNAVPMGLSCFVAPNVTNLGFFFVFRLIYNAFFAEIGDEGSKAWKNVFYYGGGMLLFSSTVTAFVLYLQESQLLGKMQSKLNLSFVSPLQTANKGLQSGRDGDNRSFVRDTLKQGGSGNNMQRSTEVKMKKRKQIQKPRPWSKLMSSL